jgi:predicted O-methyltransferase YrrM
MRNIARNSLRPHYLPVLARKLAARLRSSHHDEAVRWASERAQDLPEFGRALDSALWAESEAWAEDFRCAAKARFDALGVRIGGGGHFQLVHFLVRYLQPRVVLETGVAAGWTSQAILTALEQNGEGTLYSSDFPYFRLEEPERYVGCLVDDALRPRWHLALNGDRANLPVLLPQMGRIDLVHYDSDKSIEGRRFVMGAIAAQLDPDAVVVMDDIDDNTFFRDWVAEEDRPCRVFARRRKYVGLTGPAAASWSEDSLHVQPKI